jgi:DNA-binding NtrC family response regulator
MKHKIVVVDDEPMTVKALKRLFESQPFDFFIFNSPQQALEQIDEISPQVILSDQRIPEMEGVRFLEKVGKKWPETVRMILTGFCIPENVHGAFSRGEILKVVAKPWDDNQLLQQIHTAFHYFDSVQFAKTYQCDICGEKGRPDLIQMHYFSYMCRRCKNLYELLPGVVFKSLRRFVTGNVL